jgi:hypothetical protein
MAYNVPQISPELMPRFQEAILNVLIKENGSASVSHVLQELRFNGWRGLGSYNSQFEEMAETAGFTLDRRTLGNKPWSRGDALERTYITL